MTTPTETAATVAKLNAMAAGWDRCAANAPADSYRAQSPASVYRSYAQACRDRAASLTAGQATPPAALNVWEQIIVAIANDDPMPSRHLRAAWVVGAMRRVHDLSDLTHDNRSTDLELTAVLAADPYSPEQRAPQYLAEYAARLDDRATAVDRLAEQFAAPDDKAQQRAGTRPPLHTVVTVADMPGRWRVIARSATEQRRDPYRIRVQQEGHTVNGSVLLRSVQVYNSQPVVYVQADQRCPSCGCTGRLHRRRNGKLIDGHCAGVSGSLPGQPIRPDDTPCLCTNVMD